MLIIDIEFLSIYWKVWGDNGERFYKKWKDLLGGGMNMNDRRWFGNVGVYRVIDRNKNEGYNLISFGFLS